MPSDPAPVDIQTCHQQCYTSSIDTTFNCLVLKPPHVHDSWQAQHFATDLGHSLNSLFDTVSQSLLESCANMISQFDRSTKKRHYKAQDTVMLWNHQNKVFHAA